ncbi:MAG: bifunctional DNA-formamidopyrimidine glycosylase/DNA-(apurinic or apyrimidinic site) lyase [Candidatus Jidaibacter sp.]|jgi:formamidopyrimidine-DNA glycosylase|nr:bifunctional DNA-formamidopyrimidine glycosylase/DNA-(apurinic or apyrimidinic site) lyase [Candidatus Jidaibacter sp.]
MPELPEVHTVVCGLQSSIVGLTVKSSKCSELTFRGRRMQIEQQELVGRKIISCRRRGKYIIIEFESGDILLIHLGMSGKVLINAGAQKHDHLTITFTNGSALIFNDPRRFGVVKFIRRAHFAKEPLLCNLGLEPLELEFTKEALANICAGRKAQIKSVIMNANLVVGIGNIYASEALYMAGILPNRRSCDLSSQEIQKLHASIIEVLNLAIKSGGSTLRDYVRSNGDVGYFQHQFKVYGKHGEPCRACNKEIQKIVIGARSTFFCNGCQR